MIRRYNWINNNKSDDNNSDNNSSNNIAFNWDVLKKKNPDTPTVIEDPPPAIKFWPHSFLKI